MADTPGILPIYRMPAGTWRSGRGTSTLRLLILGPWVRRIPPGSPRNLIMPFHYDLLEAGLGISARPASGDDVRDSPFGGVLNLCDFRPPRYAATLPSGIELGLRPINDEIPAPLPTLKLAVLELAEMRSREVATLVHCQAGQSRSPTVVALYWMARDGVTWSDALNRLREIRPMIEPNRFFQTEPQRNTIVDAIRDFMAGDLGLLERARQQHAALIETLKQPQHDLALGIPGVSRLAERIFATPGPLMLDALTVPAVGLFVCAGTDTMERGLPGERGLHWRRAVVAGPALGTGLRRSEAPPQSVVDCNAIEPRRGPWRVRDRARRLILGRRPAMRPSSARSSP